MSSKDTCRDHLKVVSTKSCFNLVCIQNNDLKTPMDLHYLNISIALGEKRKPLNTKCYTLFIHPTMETSLSSQNTSTSCGSSHCGIPKSADKHNLFSEAWVFSKIINWKDSKHLTHDTSWQILCMMRRMTCHWKNYTKYTILKD